MKLLSRKFLKIIEKKLIAVLVMMATSLEKYASMKVVLVRIILYISHISPHTSHLRPDLRPGSFPTVNCVGKISMMTSSSPAVGHRQHQSSLTVRQIITSLGRVTL